jgi:hypothetical protein
MFFKQKTYFPEKTFPYGSFSGPKVGACHKCPKGPGPNKKKRKIGTIFCPKGGLAVEPKMIDLRSYYKINFR